MAGPTGPGDSRPAGNHRPSKDNKVGVFCFLFVFVFLYQSRNFKFVRIIVMFINLETI